MKKSIIFILIVLTIGIVVSDIALQAEDGKKEFTFMFLTDTHIDLMCTTENLTKISEWIVENQKKYNIKLLAHQGDVADRRGSGNINEMLQASRQALQPVMDADIPISIAIGNHDYDMTAFRSVNSFNRPTAFGIEFYEGRSWFGGTFEYEVNEPGRFPGGTVNHYVLLDIEDHPYLILTLEYRARDKVMEWADDLVKNRYPDHNVLVNTHCFLTRTGTLSTGRYIPEQPGPDYSNNAVELWSKYFSSWENLRIIINGHYIDNPTQAYIQKQGIHGNTVHIHFWNYQNWALTREGYLFNTRTAEYNAYHRATVIRMFIFDLEENVIKIRHFMPTAGVVGDPAIPSSHVYIK